MELLEFDNTYNNENKIIADYGNDKIGRVLTDSIRSLNGYYFVYIDNFANRVKLADITALTDTKILLIKPQ